MYTYSESLWWKLFKNHKRTQIQRQRQWQRQRHRQSAWKTQHRLYFWNLDDLFIPNMMIDTSPWSSCSLRSPWLPCSGHTISSTGPSVSPFRDFSSPFLSPPQKKTHFPSPNILLLFLLLKKNIVSSFSFPVFLLPSKKICFLSPNIQKSDFFCRPEMSTAVR